MVVVPSFILPGTLDMMGTQWTEVYSRENISFSGLNILLKVIPE